VSIKHTLLEMFTIMMKGQIQAVATRFINIVSHSLNFLLR